MGMGVSELFGASRGDPLLLGSGVDLLGTLWTFDTVSRMLQGTAGVINPDVFAPIGWDQGAAQAYAWLDAVLAYPLVVRLGDPWFYNLYVVIVLLCTQWVT